MKRKIINELKLLLFAALIGAFAGCVFWLFLFLVQKGTWLVWELLPQEVVGSLWYGVLACGLLGLLIGVLRMRLGDYPEPMPTVFGKLKRTGTYPYQKMPAILVLALLPLITGASVGPEAGMVGVIVALCCWAGENLRFAGGESAYYSRVGASASLSALFRSPLFGFFEVEEGSKGDARELARVSKILVYCMATAAAFGIIAVLNGVFGSVMEGFPSFEVAQESWQDVALFVPYVLCGIALGFAFEVSEQGFHRLGKRLPPVVGEVAAGIIIGVVGSLAPALRFSGEEQMGALIAGGYAQFAPMVMVGIALLKILLTSLCIGLGIKGGHLFPLIFASVCLGMGISLLLFAGDLPHATIASAIVAAATLAVNMRKPLAVAMLLLLCFPARMLLWIVPAAAVTSWAVGLIPRKRKGGAGQENDA